MSNLEGSVTLRSGNVNAMTVTGVNGGRMYVFCDDVIALLLDKYGAIPQVKFGSIGKQNMPVMSPQVTGGTVQKEALSCYVTKDVYDQFFARRIVMEKGRNGIKFNIHPLGIRSTGEIIKNDKDNPEHVGFIRLSIPLEIILKVQLQQRGNYLQRLLSYSL